MEIFAILILLIVLATSISTSLSGGYDWHGDERTRRVLEYNDILTPREQKSSLGPVLVGTLIIFLILCLIVASL